MTKIYEDVKYYSAQLIHSLFLSISYGFSANREKRLSIYIVVVGAIYDDFFCKLCSYFDL